MAIRFDIETPTLRVIELEQVERRQIARRVVRINASNPCSEYMFLDDTACNLHVIELEQVERRQIARRVVQEHVFRTRVRGIDPAVSWASMPLVDGRIKLQTGVGA